MVITATTTKNGTVEIKATIAPAEFTQSGGVNKAGKAVNYKSLASGNLKDGELRVGLNVFKY